MRDVFQIPCVVASNNDKRRGVNAPESFDGGRLWVLQEAGAEGGDRLEVIKQHLSQARVNHGAGTNSAIEIGSQRDFGERLRTSARGLPC